MARLYIRQDLLASNSRTIIKDEDNHAVFLLVGRWGSRGDVLSLYKMDGEIVASIKQATFSFTPGARFDLYQGFDKVGSLHRILSFNRDFYYVRRLGWVVSGQISQQEYRIMQLNRTIMTMSREILPNGNFYVLDIVNDTDAPLAICIAAVLNYWLQNRQPTREQLKKYIPNFNLE